ncbi:MAG: hypothetical protein JWL97_2991 [Gemmatimonadales bacterium]|nr:hypothetical protein [Gemmatimonadales bacterium]
MRTTDEMIARELEPRADQGTSLGIFYPGKNTIPEVLAAASACERLGYMPEIRFIGSDNDPAAIEVFTHDVTTLITKLRASVVESNGKSAS